MSGGQSEWERRVAAGTVCVRSRAVLVYINSCCRCGFLLHLWLCWLLSRAESEAAKAELSQQLAVVEASYCTSLACSSRSPAAKRKAQHRVTASFPAHPHILSQASR